MFTASILSSLFAGTYYIARRLGFEPTYLHALRWQRLSWRQETLTVSLFVLLLIGVVGVFLWGLRIGVLPSLTAASDYVWSTDYPVLATAHAVNIETAFETDQPRKITGLNTIHPGVPFQVMNWVALKASCILGSSQDESVGCIDQLYRAPQLFRFLSHALHGGLSLLGIVILGGFLFFYERWLGFFAVLVLCASPVVVSTYFNYPSNDSFALLFGAVAFIAAAIGWKTLFSEEKLIFWPWMLAGFFVGLAYASRLNYITWLAGIGGVLLGAFLFDRRIRVKALRAGILFGIAALLSFCLSVALFLSPEAVPGIVRHHFRYADHTGLHAQGERGFIDAAQFWSSFLAFVQQFPETAFVLFFSLGAAIFVVAQRGLRKAPMTAGTYFLASVILAIAFAGIAMFKHYKPYYVVPLWVLLPFLWAPIWGLVPETWRRIATAAAAVLVIPAVWQADAFIAAPGYVRPGGVVQYSRTISADLAKIKSDSAFAGSAVAYSYDTGTRELWAVESAHWSGSALAMKSVEHAYPNTFYYNKRNRKIVSSSAGWQDPRARGMTVLILRRSDDLPEGYISRYEGRVLRMGVPSEESLTAPN